MIDKYLNRLKNDKDGPGSAETAKRISQTIKPYTNGNINGLIGTYGWETRFALLVEARNKKIYSFEMSQGDGYIDANGLKLFDQILSTFKSTN